MLLAGKFVMWSAWHYLYIAAPIVITLILYFLLRKRSYTTRYIVGVIIGIASLAVLITRNVDIYLSNGFDPEIIPLQVCHFGNILVFITLVFRSKSAGAAAFSLNMIAAYLSHIFADSLPHYDNIWGIRPQTYIWGHLLIVVGALYAITLKIVRVRWKDFGFGCLIVIAFLIPSIILNSYFNDVLGKTINYFYIYNSNGIPLEFIYGLVPRSQYGWFTIDWVYTILVILIGLAVMIIVHSSQYLLYIKDKDYDTHHIFYNLIHKKKEEKLEVEEVKTVDAEPKKEEITNRIVIKNTNSKSYEDLVSNKTNIVIVKKDK